jgi:hypothetical protein
MEWASSTCLLSARRRQRPSNRTILAYTAAVAAPQKFCYLAYRRLNDAFAREEGHLIRAILKNGTNQPIDALPANWCDGQELILVGDEPSDDPAVIKEWYRKLVALSVDIQPDDHKRMAKALVENDRIAKDLMRREMGFA